MNTVTYATYANGRNIASFKCSSEEAEKALARDAVRAKELGYKVAFGKEGFTGVSRTGEALACTVSEK